MTFQNSSQFSRPGFELEIQNAFAKFSFEPAPPPHPSPAETFLYNPKFIGYTKELILQ